MFQTHSNSNPEAQVEARADLDSSSHSSTTANGSAEYLWTDWPRVRNVIEYVLRAEKPYTFYGHGELDVTHLFEKMEFLRKNARILLSLNTYLIYAISRIAMKHEKARTFKFKKKCIVFKNVDISVPILKILPNGVKVPVFYLVREANTKSLAEINEEMRCAIKSDLANDPIVKFRRSLLKRPLFIQSLIYRHIFKNPIRTKKFFGNIGLTNLQYLGFSSPFVGLPPNIYTCQFSAGSVTERFVPDQDKKPVLRKMLMLGAGMDHLIMDGLCISSFGNDLAAMLAKAEGIDEKFVLETNAYKNSRKQKAGKP